MSSRPVKALTIVVAILIVCLSVVLPAQAAAQQIFKGTVTMDNEPAPKGCSVAIFKGKYCVAATITDAEGKYGYSSPFAVSGTEGDLFEFFVNGIKAKETAIFEAGKTTTLNLTIVTGSPLSFSTSPPPESQPSPPPLSLPASQPSPTPSPPPASQPSPTPSPPPASQPSPPPSSPPPSPQSPQPATNQQVQPEVSPSAANFIVSNLTLSPESVKPGEPVTITAEVKNSGGSEGSYKVTLQVNGANEVEQTVTLRAGKTQKVIYAISREVPADYSVTINGQTRNFSVSTSSTPGLSWITNLPWWAYVVIGVVALLVIFFIIVVVQRRRYSY